MFPLNTETPFSRDQVIAVTRAMLQIAHVDAAGLAEEVEMIQNFYDGFRNGNGEEWPDFTSVRKEYSDAVISADIFPAAEQREMILSTCTMVAFADGEISPNELSALARMAEDLRIDAERYKQILALVKDHMLMQLSGLPDTGSIIAVAKELG